MQTNTPATADQQHEASATVAHQQRVAVLVSLVTQLRTLRAVEGRLTFTEVVARHVGTDGYSVLAEVAADLDAAAPQEVDAELRKLWAGALASSTAAR